MEKKKCNTCKKKQEIIEMQTTQPDGSERINKNIYRDFTPEDRALMVKINENQNMIQNDDVGALFTLYRQIFNRNVDRCNCPGVIAQMIKLLNDEL